ncbi:hypothetical protein CAEBREN_06227 [Caenorhabditis brenneri]|uniref:G-protein coupled receptors family 1 profile domain-containing protein n=1 Tax=Caenorhabditis brenneri TaxID=135651 RepID=G0PMN3_CAEBE|nr:hypothetical protein CAEBREN_06227 [Caenorhabditis brenneri]
MTLISGFESLEYQQNVLSFLLFWTNLSHSVFLYATPIGVLINFLHFLVLTRKNLRSNVIFELLIGICVFNILDHLLAFKKELDPIFQNPNYCAGYGSFMSTVFSVLCQYMRQISTTVSRFLVAILGFLHISNLPFQGNPWLQKTLKPSTVTYTILTVTVITSFWYYVSMFYKQSIRVLRPTDICFDVKNISGMNRDEQFTIDQFHTEYQEVFELIVDIESAMQLMFPTVYLVLVIILVKFRSYGEKSLTSLVITLVFINLILDIPALILKKVLPFFPITFMELA